jgi:hypothetical protein
MNLHTYDNRARMFLHEMSHLDYFVNALNTVPPITNTKLSLNYNSKAETNTAYGPLRAKIFRN